MNRPDPNDPYARYDPYGRKLAPGLAGWMGRLASEEQVVPQKRSEYAAWRRSQRRHRLGNAVLLLMFPPAAILYLLATRDPGAGVTLVFKRFDTFAQEWIVVDDYPPLGPLKLDWLLGFRTGVVWKRVVSSPVYAFIGFALVFDILTGSLVGLAWYLAMLLVIVLVGLYLPESGWGNARLQLWSYSDPRNVELRDGADFQDAQGRYFRIFLA